LSSSNTCAARANADIIKPFHDVIILSSTLGRGRFARAYPSAMTSLTGHHRMAVAGSRDAYLRKDTLTMRYYSINLRFTHYKFGSHFFRGVTNDQRILTDPLTCQRELYLSMPTRPFD
jgi:hypothetical protein